MSTQSAPSSSQAIEPKSWEWGIAPHYIGLFLWVAFFDRLAPTTLIVGGLLPSVAGAAAGGVLTFLLLYLGPAWLGFRTKQSMPDLIASCFGERGAKWLGGLIVGLGLVTMYSLAIAYGVDWTLKGLVQCRLIDAEALRSVSVDGRVIGSPLFLFTSTVWAIVSSLIALKFSRWIAALMVVFPVFPALLLGGIAAWEFTGLSSGIATVGSTVQPSGGFRAFLSMIQLIVGFFALPSLISADWGAAGKSARDVRLGGLVGVMLASMIVATLALLALTGSIGGSPDSTTLVVPAAVTPRIPDSFWRFESLLTRDVGGPAGGAMLMLFALGALAPAVYTAERIGRRFLVFRPKLKRWRWTMILTVLSLPLSWTILRIPVETLFGVMGAFLAPIAGVLTAEAIWPRELPEPKRGFVFPAVFAWLVGLTVGLLPIMGELTHHAGLQRIQPAALLAFLVACGIHALTRRSARPGAAVEESAATTS
jgi:cytosine permease